MPAKRSNERAHSLLCSIKLVRLAIMSITKERKMTLIQELKISPKDTGSTSIQITILTEKIAALTGHLKNAPKDFTSRVGLFKMVGQRRRLSNYLKRLDQESYQKLIQRLELRK